MFDGERRHRVEAALGRHQQAQARDHRDHDVPGAQFAAAVQVDRGRDGDQEVGEQEAERGQRARVAERGHRVGEELEDHRDRRA